MTESSPEQSRRGSKSPAVFLDRDGVINFEREDYVKNVSEFKFIDGSIEGIRILSQLGFPIVVITNQSAIGRGLMTFEELDRIHTFMISEVGRGGGKLSAIYYCLHKPEDKCDCRKPMIGLFKRAENDLNISLPDSWYIGDKTSDEEAGKSAGCRTIVIASNTDAALLETSRRLSDVLNNHNT